MIIVLLGPPGAGKGTQADKLSARLGIPKIATGDVLRAALRDGTKRGLEAKSYMDRGDLVPDSVILGILQDVMTSPATAKGAILDGAVRTVPQAEGLGAMLSEIGKKVDNVLLFDIEVAFLYPWALAMRTLAWPGLIQIVVFFLILVVGYVYIWRKGVLNWGPEFDPDYKHAPKPGPALVKRYRYGTRN